MNIEPNIFLTREAFELHARKLREEKAKQYGMTLVEWDNAVMSGKTVFPVTGSTTSDNTP